MLGSKTTRFLFVVLCGLASPLFAQDLVGARARGIEFVGAKTFTRAEILAALKQRPIWWKLSHPSAPLGPWIRHLQQEVLLGYRYHGFPDATVEVEPTARGVRVTVNEGKRFLAGPVRVVGNREVPTDFIVRALTETYTAGFGLHVTRVEGVVVEVDPKEAFWVPGQPAVLGSRAMQEAWGRLEWAFRDLGRYGPVGRVETKLADNGKYELVVHIESEGKPLKIGSIVYEGKFDAAPEELSKRLGLAKGMLFTRKLHQQVIEKLDAMGRYAKAEIVLDPAFGRDGRLDPLKIHLERGHYAPPFGQMPWDDLATLRRGRAWLSEFLSRGHLHVVMKATSPDSFPVQRLGLRFANQGAVVELTWFQIGPYTVGHLSLVLRPDRLTIVLHDQRAYVTWRFDSANVQVECKVVPVEKAGTGTLFTTFRFGLNSTPFEFPMNLEITNQALLAVLTSEAIVKASDATAVRLLKSGTGHDQPVAVAVDRASGAVSAGFRLPSETGISLDVRLVEEPVQLSIDALMARVRQRGYLRLDDRATEVLGRRVFDDFLAGLDWPDPACKLLCGCAIRALAKKDAFPRQREEAKVSKRFEFEGPPSTEPTSQWKLLVEACARALEELFPTGTWPQRLCREAPELLAPSGKRDERFLDEFGAIYESDKVSAVGDLAVARFLTFVGRSRVANAFAYKGLEHLEFARTWTDLQTLVGNASLPNRALRVIGRSWRELASRTDDKAVKKLFADVSGEDPLAWTRVGLEHLWNHIFGPRIQAELQKLAK